MSEFSLLKQISGRGCKGKDCAPLGRGWQGQRLRALGEGVAGAKIARSRGVGVAGAETALPRGGGDMCKDCYIMFYKITKSLRALPMVDRFV